MNYLKNKLSNNIIILNLIITLLVLLTYYTVYINDIFYLIKSLLIVITYISIDIIINIIKNKTIKVFTDNYFIVNSLIIVLLISYTTSIISILISIIITLLIKYYILYKEKKELIQPVLIFLLVLNIITDFNYQIIDNKIIYVIVFLNYLYLVLTKTIKLENIIIYLLPLIVYCYITNTILSSIFLILGLYVISYNQTTPLFKVYNYIYCFLLSMFSIMFIDNYNILIIYLIVMNILSKYFDFIALKRR